MGIIRMPMLAIALVAAACSSAASDRASEADETVTAVYVEPAAPGADQRMITVYRPPSGTDHPMVVLLHGGGATRVTPAVVEVAESLAERGRVVLVPDHGTRGTPDQGMVDGGRRIREGLEDAVCAVRYAVERADEIGGDPGRMSIVGHSAGGLIAALVFLGGEDLAAAWSAAANGAVAGKQTRCPSTAELPRLVGMVGYNPGLFVFARSGLEESNPELARMVDPRSFVDTGQPGTVRFVVGGSDTGQPEWHKDEVRRFASELEALGHDARAVTIDDAEHDWTTSGPVWHQTLDIILSAT